ncbi:tail sheath protein [Synechococcus phage S-CBWM1]|uniref:Tail sheath protein n=1 Tax=Synechococcus phage S-CBWM1 TaxID=2053653 RepID=A0A3G1L3U1_9CAUD|nr:tail sheath protein [Synechococcus phage S-CBWM1]ATW62851.1 tail sheath protein [Synechococcus phage S-CBWM1]
MASLLNRSVPGAPGTYVNERGGLLGVPTLARHDTFYCLVEAPSTVPTTTFPFNSPVPITSLADYRELVGGSVPTERIPGLCYRWVEVFFRNAVSTGDLRVIRVGTPNLITEIEISPSAKKTNDSGIPSFLEAGDTVYVQMTLNGIRLVSGDGITGFTSAGEYLGVPVTIPTDYIQGDAANNRLISKAIAEAIAEAIDSNPNLASSVYVRDFGRTIDLDPTSDSETAYIVIAGTAFDSAVSVVPMTSPVGSGFVFSTNAYEVSQANGQQSGIVRVPQDYMQCIDTSLEDQRDQGFLFAPGAFCQFDKDGRVAVGNSMAAKVQDPALRWQAIVDAGPFLVTDINKYRNFIPHKPAADLAEGSTYLIDNAIYQWIGVDQTYPKLSYQEVVAGSSPKIAIQESTNSAIAPQEQVGLIDSPTYTIYSPTATSYGRLFVDEDNVWPVDLKIQKVVLGGADSESNPFNALEGNVYVVAAPYDTEESGDYSKNVVFLAPNASSASSVYNYVVGLKGSKNVTQLPPGAINIAASAIVSSCTVSYTDSYYDLEVTINGQTSDLLENVSDRAYGINTQHLPATLQDPTQTFNIGMFSRVFNDPSATGSGNGGVYRGATDGDFPNAAVFDCAAHGLADGTKIYFNKPILTAGGRYVVNATTRKTQNPYYVRSVSDGTFVLASSLTNFAAGSYLKLATGDTVATSTPVIAYSGILAGNGDALAGELDEVDTLALIRARKYALDSSTVYNQVTPSSDIPTSDAKNRGVAIELNRSSSILGEGTVAPIGETPNAGYLPRLELLDPPVAATALATLYGNVGSIAGVDPAYVTRDADGLATAIDDSEGVEPSAQGYWNVIGEALMFVPPVWVENNGTTATLTWEWKVDGVAVGSQDDKVAVLTSALSLSGGEVITVSWSLTDGTDTITGTTAATPEFLTAASLAAENYSLSGNGQVTILNPDDDYYVGRVVNYRAASLTDSGSGTAITSRETQVLDYAGSALFPVGSDAQAVALKTASTGSYQLPGSLNGKYAAIRTTIVVNSKTFVNTVSTPTAIGPLQAFAVSTWANGGVTVPSSWDIKLSSLDVAFFGAQNFVCVPTVKQSFETESYLVPNFPAFEGGSYNATTNQTASVVTGSYANLSGLANTAALPTSQGALAPLLGVYLKVTTGGTLPTGTGGESVTTGEFIVVAENNGVYSWVVVKKEEDLGSYSVPMWGGNVKLSYRNEQAPPSNLWRFDAVTSAEIIDVALRGINNSGNPQAVLVETGIDTPNRLMEDSQRYFEPSGFIAFDGPHIERIGGDVVPLTAYRAGILAKSIRERGPHYPGAGVRYQLVDAVLPQIAISSAHQNLMNPAGCNVARTLPGYPDNSVFIWAARNRVNADDAEQAQYRFMNTRVIMNIAYGTLRSAFDSQIFTVVEGFNILADKIVSIGNNALYPMYSAGYLFGDRPADAFQVVCDGRINDYTNLEDGIVFVEVFAAPSPTMERISIGLVRATIGQMKETLEASGLG